jgi:excisionase family DNA binding protein
MMPGFDRQTTSSAATQPRLITVTQAAELLAVDRQTVRNWIDRKLVPYIVLPHEEGGRQEYRIPLQGLLTSLTGTYDLSQDLDVSKDLDRINQAAQRSNRKVDPLTEMYKRPR